MGCDQLTVTNLWWLVGCDQLDVTTGLCGLWPVDCDQLTVVSWLWPVRCDYWSLTSWLWPIDCGLLAVTSSMWLVGCSHAVAILEHTTHLFSIIQQTRQSCYYFQLSVTVLKLHNCLYIRNCALRVQHEIQSAINFIRIIVWIFWFYK